VDRVALKKFPSLAIAKNTRGGLARCPRARDREQDDERMSGAAGTSAAFIASLAIRVDVAIIAGRRRDGEVRRHVGGSRARAGEP
jgi:hypothetical protein